MAHVQFTDVPDRPPVQRVPELSPADPGGSAAVYSHVCKDLLPTGGARSPVRHGPEQGQSVDPRPAPCAPGGAAHPRGCPRPFPERPGPAAWGLGGRRRPRVPPLEEELAPLGAAPAAAPASPLLPMTGPSDVSSAPKTLLNRKRVIAARKETTRSKMSS